MRKIAIIGGGQCGLHLAFGLLNRGCDVTLYSERSAEQVLAGRIASTAFLFNSTLQMERKLGLNFWEDEAPLGEGIAVDFREPGGKSVLAVKGRLLDKAGQALDPRTKFARWMGEFEKRGGTLVVQAVSVRELDLIAGQHALTIVAAGKGTLQNLFARDDEKSVHRSPARHIAAVLLRGPKMLGDRPWPGTPFRPLRFNFVSGVGEFFSLPFFSHTVGECRSFHFEARPGSAMDRFNEARDGAEVLALARDVVAQFAPEDLPQLEQAELTDPNAWLKAAFTPVVRHPVSRLPSGRAVLAAGDTACLDDPIAGQGANNASRMADFLVRRIAAHGEAVFDEEWMHDAMRTFWDESASYTTAFTNALLEPPGAPLLEVLHAASRAQPVADAFVGCFDNPRSFWPWIADIGEARSFIRVVSAP
jgi:2-polyprenyl-6-methoxyphenol hydroxylase-like FAD-dependent oxidoreductase